MQSTGQCRRTKQSMTRGREGKKKKQNGRQRETETQKLRELRTRNRRTLSQLFATRVCPLSLSLSPIDEQILSKRKNGKTTERNWENTRSAWKETADLSQIKQTPPHMALIKPSNKPQWERKKHSRNPPIPSHGDSSEHHKTAAATCNTTTTTKA
jgi:hypothetical protein